MAAKLYVGNLAYAVTDDRLQEHFAQHGSVVSARVITDKFSGRSKGFGFVEMASDAEAAKALNALNGTDFEGRNIVVSEARPQAPRPSGAGGYAGGGAGPPQRGRDRC
ncbi:MAG: RNA recognition motif domain-containing protein [Candidatus Binatia bacterium]